MNRPSPAAVVPGLALLLMLAGCGVKKSATSGAVPDTVRDSAAHAAAAPVEQPLSYEERQGKFLYGKFCAVCHGESGKGDGFNAFNLDPKPRDFTNTAIMDGYTDERIAQAIAGGGRSVNKSPLMPTWGGRLNTREIAYLVRYLRPFAAAKP